MIFKEDQLTQFESKSLIGFTPTKIQHIIKSQ